MLNYLRTRLKLSFDRSFSGSWIRQILWLAAASVVSYFIIVLLNDLFWHRVLDARTIALLLIDPGNASNDTQTPYFPAIFLIAVFGVFIFSGMLVSVISNILERRVENFRKGEIHYQFRDHVLVLGFDTMVTHSVHRLCMDERYKDCDIIVQSSQDIEYIREEILTGLSSSEFRRIVFIHARISSVEELRKTHAHHAREVFIFGERTCEEHDSVNIAAVTAIARICEEKKRKTRLTCHVMLNHQTSYAIFQLADLDPTVKAHINFRPFNLNEIWSQRVLAGKAGYTPLDPPVQPFALYLLLAGKARRPDCPAEYEVALQQPRFSGHRVGIHRSDSRIALRAPAAHPLGRRRQAVSYPCRMLQHCPSQRGSRALPACRNL